MKKHTIKYVKTTIYIPKSHLDSLNIMSQANGTSNSRIIQDLLDVRINKFVLPNGKKLTDIIKFEEEDYSSYIDIKDVKSL